MTKKEKLQIAAEYYPNAKMELNYTTPFQLLVAVMLSAQTTDISVNKATKELFEKYLTSYDFQKLNYDEIYKHIKILGLANTKTRNLIKLSKEISNKYQGNIPRERKELMELAGVGQKTANVVLAELYNQSYIAVDTHIDRIAKRLYISKQKATVKEVEKDLERVLKGEDLKRYHHSLIFFGRYHCKAQKPNCKNCKLQEECRYFKKLKKNK